MKKTILLIDGSSFIFRAFHAMPNLTAPDKTPTGAIYGILNMLKMLLKQYDTPYWACVFDTPGKTFRNEIYPEYKANRGDTPESLIPQFKYIYKLIPALGIPIIAHDGVEADDVLGTLAIYAKDHGYKTLIATSDKDFAQLVDEDITLINTMSNETLDIQGVIKKFGVLPTQIIDFLSLVGDKIDNIPGVDKCGPITAVKWLKQYESLENIILHADKITGVVGTNLRNAKQWLHTAKQLITINTKVNLSHIIPNGISDLHLNSPNYKILKETYQQLGFNKWLEQLNTVNIQESPNTKLTDNISKLLPLKNVDSLELLKIMVHEIEEKYNHILIYLITDSNKLTIDKILITTQNEIFAIKIQPAFQNDLFTTTNTYNLDIKYHNILQHLFNNKKISKSFINYKETLKSFKLYNLDIINIKDDLTLLHYVINSKNSHKISYIFQEILQVYVTDNNHNINQKSNNPINTDELINNYIVICSYAQQVINILFSKLNLNEEFIYKSIEIPLVNVLVKMEIVGFSIDKEKFHTLNTQLSHRITALEDLIYKEANTIFNISSTKQLQEILFQKLQLPVEGIKKNTNGFSTDETSLKILEQKNIKIASLLLEYRTLTKLLNTYVNKLPQLTDINNKIHTTFEQAVVATGRLSSKDPNLQNIPIKTNWGKKIRECFIASDNHQLICADYSQIELRILANFCKDDNLITAFNMHQDIHSITASEIFNKPIDQINSDERRYAKIINFSLLYGKTIYGLANELNIDHQTAKRYIETYFARYPKIKTFLEELKQQAHEKGYVETLFGRKIYLPDINSHNKFIREAEERVAINSPMQGTSSDIIKIAMNRLNTWIMNNNLKTQLILQIHDELILDVPNNEVEIIKNNLSTIMTTDFPKMTVKITIGIKIANNWGDVE